jgi:hypothetical protein
MILIRLINSFKVEDNYSLKDLAKGFLNSIN